VDAYLKEAWKPLYPIATYLQSTKDANAYEDVLPGEDNTFDHETGAITTGKYSSFLYTPGANTYTFEMAKAAVRGEELGKDAFTDMLAVSFSATDYAGHKFGPNSIEMEDMFLRFDRDLASFLSYLDASVGKGQYLLFLTADHGVAQVPGFFRENKLPAGLVDDAPIVKNLNDSLNRKFGLQKAIEHVSNYQLYLDDAVLARWKGDRGELNRYIVEQLLKHPAISHAFELSTMGSYPLPADIKEMVANGYSPVRSGNFQLLFKPQWFDGGTRGTTHGSWNPYDAHIPLLWYGTGIERGKLHRAVHMTDIAPTLAAMLGIQMPNATVGKVIEEILPLPAAERRR
jgi:predicted AlkP superfamily pyrophosphatase or phosphodiesterase